MRRLGRVGGQTLRENEACFARGVIRRQVVRERHSDRQGQHRRPLRPPGFPEGREGGEQRERGRRGERCDVGVVPEGGNARFFLPLLYFVPGRRACSPAVAVVLLRARSR